MSYCEGDGQLDYVFGLAKNSRLIKAIDTEMAAGPTDPSIDAKAGTGV